MHCNWIVLIEHWAYKGAPSTMTRVGQLTAGDQREALGHATLDFGGMPNTKLHVISELAWKDHERDQRTIQKLHPANMAQLTGNGRGFERPTFDRSLPRGFYTGHPGQQKHG